MVAPADVAMECPWLYQCGNFTSNLYEDLAEKYVLRRDSGSSGGGEVELMERSADGTMFIPQQKTGAHVRAGGRVCPAWVAAPALARAWQRSSSGLCFPCFPMIEKHTHSNMQYKYTIVYPYIIHSTVSSSLSIYI